MPSFEAVAGALVGCALGDALGLPWEGGARGWVERRAPRPLAHSFWFGRGLGSDDTEHSRIVLAALIEDPTAGPGFDLALARGLRWWFLGLPPGTGLATARACAKLLVGFGPSRSGVFSAGNGPAMRAAVVGAMSRGRSDAGWLPRAVRATTRITHTDPTAEAGALWVARLAAADGVDAEALDRALHGLSGPLPVAVRGALARVASGQAPESLYRDGQWVDPGEESASAGDFNGSTVWSSTERQGRISGRAGPERAGANGFEDRGPTGYVVDTLVAVAAVLAVEPSFRGAVERAVRLGGDADTVAAIVGGIRGAEVGRSALPADWVAGWGDWPWTIERLDALARSACDGLESPVVPPVALPRNLAVLAIAVGHILRRWAG